MVSNPIDNSPIDEETLVSRLIQGDEDAYRILIRTYQKRVFRIAYGITMDHEESLDISQEVFLSVFQNIRRFEQKATLATWMHRMTVNRCLNWKRRWKRRLKWQHQPFDEEARDGAPESGENIPDSLYFEKESGRRIAEGLSTLPEDARTVFMLKEMEGLSYEKIARALKIKRGTVSSRLFYARKRLQELLKDKPDET